MFVIPMVGRSSRFTAAGYQLPKYQLELHGHSVFHHVLSSFEHYFGDDLFVFIVRKDHDARPFVLNALRAAGVRHHAVVELEGETLGQADTVRLGMQELGGMQTEPVYIFNIDTLRPRFRKSVHAQSAQGYLEVFEAEGEHWSFVEPGSHGTVLRTTEKQRISNLCSDGLYQFASKEVLGEALAHQAEQRDFSGGEYYVAPIYNTLIARGHRICYEMVKPEDVLLCGTPAEYLGLQALEPSEFARRMRAS